MPKQPVNLHGTAVSIAGEGVLIIGASGSGKSDLALRLIDRGAVLISDDRIIVEACDGQPILRTAPNIAGLIEVRGIAIISMPFTTDVKLRLVIDLDAPVLRFIDAVAIYNAVDFAIPCFALSAFEASAAIKVEYALKSVVDQSRAKVAQPSSQPGSHDDAK
jgi:HPr kinase/phosphorylase